MNKMDRKKETVRASIIARKTNINAMYKMDIMWNSSGMVLI